MDRRTEAFGDHLQRQIEEHDKQLRIYEALAAHDLYGRFAGAGFEEVVILKSGDDSLWIDAADRKSLDHPHTDKAHKIFEGWLDEYGHGAAQRLVMEIGNRQNVRTEPFASYENLIGQRDDIMRLNSRLSDQSIEAEDTAKAVAHGVKETLAAYFPDTVITEDTDRYETRFGVGEPLENGNAPLVLRLDHDEHSIETWDGHGQGARHPIDYAKIQNWPDHSEPTAEIYNEIAHIAETYGNRAQYQQPTYSTTAVREIPHQKDPGPGSAEFHATEYLPTTNTGTTGPGLG